MNNYLNLMQEVLDYGEPRMDRTGVGTRALFGRQLEFDLAVGFPAITTKKLAFKQVAAELAAFLRGAEYLSQFHLAGCKVWDANATAPYWVEKGKTPDGDIRLGRVYGVEWRRWLAQDGHTIDQLREAVDALKARSTSRRICVTAWNPGELNNVCLPPCHLYYQFYCRNDGGFDCLAVMRSVDVFLGMPFDIASYALLMHIIGREANLTPRRLQMVFGDTHIYANHVEQCQEQLAREPKSLPQLILPAGVTIDNFEPEQAMLTSYDSHPAIKATMAV